MHVGITLAGIVGLAVLAAWPMPAATEPSRDSKSFGVAAVNGHIMPVSLIYLIANPEALNGKRVRVTGVLRFEFESDHLYLDRDSYENAIVENAVGVRLGGSEGMLPGLSRRLEAELSGRIVVVEGTYWSAQPKAPCAGISGCITVGKQPAGTIRDVTFLWVRPDHGKDAQ